MTAPPFLTHNKLGLRDTVGSAGLGDQTESAYVKSEPKHPALVVKI
jgi:hypothetical protein